MKKNAKVSSVYEGRGRKRSSAMHSPKSARKAVKQTREVVLALEAPMPKNSDSQTRVMTRSMKRRKSSVHHMLIDNLHDVEVVQEEVDINPMEVVQEQEMNGDHPAGKDTETVHEVAAGKEETVKGVAAVGDCPMNEAVQEDVIQPKNEVAAGKEETVNGVTAVEDQPVNGAAPVTENLGDDGRVMRWEDWPLSLTSNDYEEVWPWFAFGYERAWSDYVCTMVADSLRVISMNDQPVRDDVPSDFKDENETKP